MSDLDAELDGFLGAIEVGKANFGDDEQNIIDAWISKLSEPKEAEDEKIIKNEYAQTLAKLTLEEKTLLPPFKERPPAGDLIPLSDFQSGSKPKKFSFPLKKLPCSRQKPAQSPQSTGVIPKLRKIEKPYLPPDAKINDFENFEEMARVIAKSKGQSFAEFVVAISRYSLDFGQELRAAMKAETISFTEYVDHVLSQRIKDLTEVLDEEQNAELQKIRKDMEKWQLELFHCKKIIKEIIPNFDIELYKKDKNYLKKVFTIEPSPGGPIEDPFKKWKEETLHRLKWYSDMIYKLTRCNDQTTQEIAEVKSLALDLEAKETMKHQTLIKYINCEMAEYERLKAERDRLHKENADLLSELGRVE